MFLMKNNIAVYEAPPIKISFVVYLNLLSAFLTIDNYFLITFSESWLHVHALQGFVSAPQSLLCDALL